MESAPSTLPEDSRDASARPVRRRPQNAAKRFTAEGVGLYLDYSKNRITAETLKLLLQLAEESSVRAQWPPMPPWKAHSRVRLPHGSSPAFQ
jgi:hypothetical protein